MKKNITEKAVYVSPNCRSITTFCSEQVIAASFGTTDLVEDTTDYEGSWTNN